MKTTVETRLQLNPEEAALLDASIETWSVAFRQAWSLYNRQYRDEKEIYHALKQNNTLTSSQINSIINKVKAEHSKLKQLSKTQIKQLTQKMDALQKFILKQRNDQDKQKTASRAALIFQKNKKLRRLHKAIQVLNDRLEKNTFKLCFGSSTLFKQQPGHSTNRYRKTAQQKVYSSHDEWKADWQAARNNHWLSIGNKNYPLGNPEFQYNPEDQSLRIRLTEDVYLARLKPAAKRLKISYKDLSDHKNSKLGTVRKSLRTITIENVSLHSKALAQYQAAIKQKQPITSKIVKKTTVKGETGYYLQMSFDEVVQPLKNTSELTMGVDLNEKGLAYCIVKSDGNKLNRKDKGFGFLPWQLKEQSARERKLAISRTLTNLLTIAESYAVSTIAIENLDFSSFTSQMNTGFRKQANLNRTISQFAKTQFKEQLTRKARRLGITIQMVNPAFSSVGGYAKYGTVNKLPVDIAASLWLARQGLYGRAYKQEDNVSLHKKHEEAVRLPYHFQTKQSKSQEQDGTWKTVASALGSDRRLWYQNFRICLKPKVGSTLSHQENRDILGLVEEPAQDYYPPERQFQQLLTLSTR